MGQRIFISYGRKDDYLSPVSLEEEHTYHLDATRSFCRQVYNVLSAAGFEVWWDREKMPNRGLTFLQEIRQAVHQADKVVYIAGDHASQSDYVKAEWQYALSQCKPVIPVLKNGEYNSIPAAIGMGNAPDMRDMRYFAEKISELIRLLQDEPSPLATLYSVPNLPEWYVERGNDVADLQAAIRADALKPIVVTSKQQTVTLQGMGGLGKTTLASALCKRCEVRTSFPDGIFWLEIGKNPSVASRLGDIGVAFGDMRDEYPDEQRGKSRLSEILRNRAALIVLDDVWDHRHVEAFRVDSPASRIVVTTRNGRMAGLLGVSQHAIDTLTAEEGMALIGKRLGRAENETSAYPEAERELVGLLGGHTLAISIAAARIAEEGAAYTLSYLQRLKDRRAQGISPLGDLQMHDDDKNFNVELSLAESYAELKPNLQAYFRALSAFAIEGSFEQSAAQALWQMSDAYAVEDTLRALVKLALVTESQDGRYSLHGLLRDYARALAEKAGEWEAAQARHFDYYHSQHSDAEANQAYNEKGEFARHALLDSDWENIQIALDWGLLYEAKKAIDWIDALQGAYMQFRRTNQEWLDLLKRALSVAEIAQYPLGEANCLKALGHVHLRKNEYAQAVAVYEQALPLYHRIGARLGEANCLQALGEVHLRKNEYAQAVEVYEQALPLYRSIGSRHGEANCLQALGEVHRMKNEYAQAVEVYQQALPLYRSIGSRHGEANCLQALGEVHRMKNEYAQAVAVYEQALPLYRSIGDRLGEANCLRALGDVHRMKNEYAQAVEVYQQALYLYNAIGDIYSVAGVYARWARLHFAIGEKIIACKKMATAIETMEKLGFENQSWLKYWRNELSQWGCE